MGCVEPPSSSLKGVTVAALISLLSRSPGLAVTEAEGRKKGSEEQGRKESAKM